MRLSYLLQELLQTQLPKEADRDISNLSLDSRQIKKQGLFLAIKGSHLDGRDYIAAAIAKGAAAILVDQTSDSFITYHNNCDVPLIPIPELQKKVGLLAARFYDFPAKKLQIIGITGTSGKTSCSHFIAQALQLLQKPCGIIGTLGSGFYGALDTTGPSLTTPDAIRLQAVLHQFVQQGAVAVAMEVSSHSIDQHRISGIEFDIGVFTNLSQDHLDYHGDMHSYASVKHRFIASAQTKQVIINADDTYGYAWINELFPQKPVIAYSAAAAVVASTSTGTARDLPMLWVDHVKLSLQGIHAFVRTPWGEGEMHLSLIGKFNLSNALTVLAVLCVSGIPFSDALNCLSQLKPVPGRMQMLGGSNQQPLIVVDYAHKPDALEKVLQALRAHTKGKLYCVFGCGGERDRGKRPLMAKIAEQVADKVIITNDNPRHENPEQIIADIMQGFSQPDLVSIELDRSKAIQNSIQWASSKDCVLIAGKGAERYQQIGDEKFPFDDVEKVKEYLCWRP